MQDRVRIKSIELLSDDRHLLRKTTYDFLNRAGAWVEQQRETYDRGNGATALLYNLARRTVLLVRQFRFPAYANGHHGFLIETPAGLLEGAEPAARMRAEIEEETGYRVETLRPVYAPFMSPGSVTERVHCFVGAYATHDQVGPGGGLPEEGEDIEVLELDIDHALSMIERGEIVDGKTIMLLQYARLHVFAPRGLMILVAGPYRSGTGGDPNKLAANVRAMEACALPLYEAGHLPVLGEWLALPMTRLAGSKEEGDEVFERIFHPHAQRLLERCDAVLRIGGPSAGADLMVTTAERLGKRVYHALAEVPGLTS